MAARITQYRPIDELCALPNSAWLTSHEAAVYLNSTPQALASRRTKGNGPAFGVAGQFIRYRKADLDSWLMGSMDAAA